MYAFHTTLHFTHNSNSSSFVISLLRSHLLLLLPHPHPHPSPSTPPHTNPKPLFALQTIPYQRLNASNVFDNVCTGMIGAKKVFEFETYLLPDDYTSLCETKRGLVLYLSGLWGQACTTARKHTYTHLVFPHVHAQSSSTGLIRLQLPACRLLFMTIHTIHTNTHKYVRMHARIHDNAHHPHKHAQICTYACVYAAFFDGLSSKTAVALGDDMKTTSTSSLVLIPQKAIQVHHVSV